jgi:hypothetical protein
VYDQRSRVPGPVDERHSSGRNPFVGVLALAIGVTLGARMLGRIVNLF